MEEIYTKIMQFKQKFPGTVTWRLKSHIKVIANHLNPGEEVLYAFAAQKNDNPLNIINTYVVCLTNKRLVLGHKRLIFGYMFLGITPDNFNDVTVRTGLIWGGIDIDTLKEVVTLSNISKRALPEIETVITEYMMTEKKKYPAKAGLENK